MRTINPYFAAPKGIGINYAQNAAVNGLSASTTLIKPLRPNILDAQADIRQKELAKERAKTGVKWVRVLER
jgi:hypothetical protein